MNLAEYRLIMIDFVFLLIVGLSLKADLFLVKTEEVKAEDVKNVDEYCLSEIFRPRCPKSEVILMTSAIYGRMRIGRCITAEEMDAQRALTRDDPRILGCSADIRPLLDKKCSGNSECDVRVFDIGADIARPCVPGLIVYLEASYTCIRVADERRSCAVTVSSDPTHLTTSNAQERLCGTKAKPWVVEAPIGQRVSITLLHFNPSSNQRDRGNCHKHGIIVEKSVQATTPICAGYEERKKLLYMSRKNSLEITFNDSPEAEEDNSDGEKLVLRLQAVGCSDIVPPEDMWLRRNEDSITIGCYNNRLMWRLNCTQGKWTGVIGNCTKANLVAESVVNLKEEKESLSENEQVLAIVAICGFTVAICIAIVCVGAVCLRRFYLESKKKQDYKTLGCFSEPTKISFDTQKRFSAAGIHGKEERRSDALSAPTYSVWMDEGDTGFINGQNNPNCD